MTPDKAVHRAAAQLAAARQARLGMNENRKSFTDEISDASIQAVAMEVAEIRPQLPLFLRR
jgi:hypothetical protein